MRSQRRYGPLAYALSAKRSANCFSPQPRARLDREAHVGLWQTSEGSGGRRIHCCDLSIKAEHLRFSWEEPSVKGGIKRAISPYQLSGAFWPNARCAGQFIGRITAERSEVRHLLRIDAIALPDFFGPDARDPAAAQRKEDRCALRGELKGIPIAARHQLGAACALLDGNRGGEKVIRLEPRALAFANPQAATNSGSTCNCSIRSSTNSRPLLPRAEIISLIERGRPRIAGRDTSESPINPFCAMVAA
jgi:hypothetical protein